uniref:Uncharacterized protein n=1 Tax=Malurus cyaneus samueli TaxID=2593467 RepID=A0A8C5X1F6_9PASS
MKRFCAQAGARVLERTQPWQRRREIDRLHDREPNDFVHRTTSGSGNWLAGAGATGAVQEMRSKGGRERQWSNSRVL